MIDRVSLLAFVMENGETTAWDVADHFGVRYGRALRALQRQRDCRRIRHRIETLEEHGGKRGRPCRIYVISDDGLRFMKHVAAGGKIVWNPYGRLYEGED